MSDPETNVQGAALEIKPESAEDHGDVRFSLRDDLREKARDAAGVLYLSPEDRAELKASGSRCRGDG